MDHFRSSKRLQRVRLPSRAYRLLNEGRLKPEHLHHFYRTYRLPTNPFFPLFLSLKQEYLRTQAEKQRARSAFIRAHVRALPEQELAMLRYLGHLERILNQAGECPLWQAELYPSTKKRARELGSLTPSGWLALFGKHLGALVARYRAMREETVNRVLALYLLGLLPEPPGADGAPALRLPPALPPSRSVNGAYRRLSMEHHPDRGGDSTRFMRAKWARDLLLNS